MSSNIKVKRVCQHCQKVFMARTTVTRFCSHTCNRNAYKEKLRNQKLQQSNVETGTTISGPILPDAAITLPKVMISVKELSAITNISERTLFRVIKDEKFPKMKIGKRLLFNKEAVINYMNYKFGCV